MLATSLTAVRELALAPAIGQHKCFILGDADSRIHSHTRDRLSVQAEHSGAVGGGPPLIQRHGAGQVVAACFAGQGVGSLLASAVLRPRLGIRPGNEFGSFIQIQMVLAGIGVRLRIDRQYHAAETALADVLDLIAVHVALDVFFVTLKHTGDLNGALA